ncbi:MAG: hypothetical protein JRJ15_09410 [Deltaproteobacteria bacterium]|nr:hypothetical protein [Deltaproteobacteria bacterium]
MQIENFEMKKSPLRRLLLCPFIVIGLILTSQSMALAHRVYIYAWADGDKIYTESYFGSNKKVKGGLIQVFDPSGKKLLEGRTNEQGEFAFTSIQKTDLRIVLEAGMGHRSESILKKEEFGGTPGGEYELVKNDGEKMESIAPISTDVEQIKTLVEQALDSRLKPIKRELARIRKEESPGLAEIIGGIGYIFGLMGLVMYFKSRKKR